MNTTYNGKSARYVLASTIQAKMVEMQILVAEAEIREMHRSPDEDYDLSDFHAFTHEIAKVLTLADSIKMNNEDFKPSTNVDGFDIDLLIESENQSNEMMQPGDYGYWEDDEQDDYGYAQQGKSFD